MLLYEIERSLDGSTPWSRPLTDVFDDIHSVASWSPSCWRVDVFVVVVVVLTLSRIIKSVVTGQAPVTPELRNTPGKKHKTNQRWYTHK